MHFSFSLFFSFLSPFCKYTTALLEKAEGETKVCCQTGYHTFVSPSAFSRRAVVSYWRKYVHEVLVNRLGGLSLPRKSVARLTDRPDMTLDVYRGRKTTIQQQSLLLPYPYICKRGKEKKKKERKRSKDLGFTVLSIIFHLYRAIINQRWAKTGAPIFLS